MTQSQAIEADELLLEGSGPYTLTNPSNDVDTLALNTSGDVQYTDTDGFDIGTVMGVAGATTPAGKLALDSSGPVTQTAPIVANELLLVGMGPYTLTAGTNDFNFLAANTGGDIQIADIDGFTIGTVMGVAGVTAPDHKLAITSGGLVDQTQAFGVGELLLLGAGDYDLQNVTNSFDVVAANTNGDIGLTNALDLVVGVVMGVQGITIEDTAPLQADLELVLTSVGGDIVQRTESDLPAGQTARIDVDVVTATFTVSNGNSISLGDLAQDFETTQNRFFNDATGLETDLLFQASSGQINNLTFMDQTAVQLTGLDITGDLVVVGGKSEQASGPYLEELAILDSDASSVLVGGNARFHAIGADPGDLSILLADGPAGNRVVVTGNATFVSQMGGAIDVGVTPSGAPAAAEARFGSLTFSTTGAVRIAEDDSTLLTGMSTAGSLELTSAAEIEDLDDSDLEVSGAATFTASTDIILADGPAGNELVVTGNATFVSQMGGAIDLGVTPAGAPAAAEARFGSLTFSTTGAVRIAEDDSTLLTGMSTAGSLELTSAAEIEDLDDSDLEVSGAATFTASTDITLADGPAGNELVVTGNATFVSQMGGAIDVGVTPSGAPAAAEARFGSLTFSTTGAVRIAEDDSTLLTGMSTAGSLELTSAAEIEDLDDSDLEVSGAATFTASTDITLADGPAGNGLVVTGNATFVSQMGGAIDVGVTPSGAPAAAEARFGSLTFSTTGAVRIAEDDSTLLTGMSTAGSLELTSAAEIEDLDDSDLEVSGAATFTASTDISLADGPAGNGLVVTGNATFVSQMGGAIDVGVTPSGAPAAAEARFGSLTFSTTGAVRIAEDDSTLLTGMSTAGSLELTSAAEIEDLDDSDLEVSGAATFTASTDITLADGPAGNGLVVTGDASFVSQMGGDIDVGVTAAGDPAEAEARFGAVSFSTAGTVRVSEDVSALEASTVRGLLLTGENRAGTLELSSAEGIEDRGDSDLEVSGDTRLTVESGAHDIVLGDNTSDRLNLNGLEIASARHASLRLDQDGMDADLFLNGVTLNNDDVTRGTLVITTANHNILQNTASPLVAFAAAFRSEDGAVVLTDTSFSLFSAITQGSGGILAGGDLDTATTRPVLDQVVAQLVDGSLVDPTDLSDEVLRDMDPTNDDLRPVVFNGTSNPLMKGSTTSSYGLVLGSNGRDLEIGHVENRAVSSQVTAGDEFLATQDGVKVDAGDAYVATTAGQGEEGDLRFSADGAADTVVVDMQVGGGTFTAVAGGGLFIDTASGAELKSGTGVVLEVNTNPGSPLEVFDGRAAASAFAENKSGVTVSITPPSNSTDAATTGVVDALERTQRIELEIGVPGEQNFLADLLPADRIGLEDPLPPVSSIQVVTGDRVIEVDGTSTTGPAAQIADAGTTTFLATFEQGFLETAGGNPNFPFLPTEVRVFNDPNINLFENADEAATGGTRNLNRSITASGAATFRQDGFVQAVAGNLPAPRELPSGPVAPVFIVPAPQVLPVPENDNLLVVEDFDDGRVAAPDQFESVVYGKVDEDGKFEDPETWDERISSDWRQRIERDVLQDEDYPPGDYKAEAKRIDGEVETYEFKKKGDPANGLEDGNGVLDGLPASALQVRVEDASGPATNPQVARAWQDWREPSQAIADSPDDAAQSPGDGEVVGSIEANSSAAGRLALDAGEHSGLRRGSLAGLSMASAVVAARYAGDKEAKTWRRAWLRHLLGKGPGPV